MRPYRFRLSAVQRVRESLRDTARQQLADAHLAADKLAAEVQRIQGEIAEVRQQRAADAAAERPDPDRLAAGQRYEAMLSAQLKDLAGKQVVIDGEAARRRDALAEADRQVRALELLDERGRERHRREEITEEQKQLDEMAIAAWRRGLTPNP